MAEPGLVLKRPRTSWNLLWHLRGSVAVPDWMTDDQVFDRIEAMLIEEGKPADEGGADFLVFDAAPWRDSYGHKWKATAIYDRGAFWIDLAGGKRRLRFDLRSLYGFLFCLLIFGPLLFAATAQAEGVAAGLKTASVVALLYGINLLIAWVRVPFLVVRTIYPERWR